MFTNLEAFLAIAKEALAQSERSFQAHTRPMPDGRPGLILSPDPDQTSFKQALIAIVFAGIYLEALLHIEGVKRLGVAHNDKWQYEQKLSKLGAPADLVEAGRQFRQTRNDVMHERASVPSAIRTAQDEARSALAFVEQVTAWLSQSAPRT